MNLLIDSLTDGAERIIEDGAEYGRRNEAEEERKAEQGGREIHL
jgi:hypothetical protein